MLKYVNTGIVFQEIPNEVTLSINISNCPCRCPGCHSQYLWKDIGIPLTIAEIDRIIEKYGSDITCICLMGGDAEPEYVNTLAQHIHSQHPRFKVGWYSGKLRIPASIKKVNFNYIKVGPYIKHLGSLKDCTTNQRLYKIKEGDMLEDITSLLWKNKKR